MCVSLNASMLTLLLTILLFFRLLSISMAGRRRSRRGRRCCTPVCCGWAAAGAEAEDDLPSQGEACCRGELVPSPLLRAHGGHADAAVRRPVTRHRDPLPWSHLKVSRKRNERNISTANWNGSKSKTPKAQIKFISNYFQ